MWIGVERRASEQGSKGIWDKSRFDKKTPDDDRRKKNILASFEPKWRSVPARKKKLLPVTLSKRTSSGMSTDDFYLSDMRKQIQ